MANSESPPVCIEPVANRNIVSLKVSPKSANDASQRLSLCEPLRIDLAEPGSLWVSPGCWLLLSESSDADRLLANCDEKLGDLLALAVDMTDGLSTVSVSGRNVRELLSSACGLDLRPDHFAVGRCVRTRFAQIPAFVARVDDDRFELTADRSYSRYLSEWLDETLQILHLGV